MEVMDKDSKWLQKHRLMDYSVFFIVVAVKERMRNSLALDQTMIFDFKLKKYSSTESDPG